MLITLSLPAVNQLASLEQGAFYPWRRNLWLRRPQNSEDKKITFKQQIQNNLSDTAT